MSFKTTEEVVVEEWRPVECGKLYGEIVRVNERTFLKVRCQRCSKLAEVDVFHYLGIDGSKVGSR